MERRDFYVYKHVRLDTNTTFYVGKGTRRRAFNKRDRNEYWKRIAEKAGYKICFIKEKLSEQEALSLENRIVLLFQKYGRCEANLTSGGGAGTKWCQISREKQSKSQKGRIPWNKGIPATEEHKQARAESVKRNGTTFGWWNVGVKHSPDSVERRLKAQGHKPFRVYNKITLEPVWEGLNQLQCMRDLNIPRTCQSAINSCLNDGIYKSFRNFVFRFVDDPEPVAEFVKRNKLLVPKSFSVFEGSTGKLVWEGSDRKECSESLGLAESGISLCLNGKLAHLKGYIFHYLDSEMSPKGEMQDPRKRIPRLIEVRDLTGNLVWLCNKITLLQAFIGIDRSSLRRCLDGTYKQCKGYTFAYVETPAEARQALLKYAASLTDADLDAMEASTMEIQRA